MNKITGKKRIFALLMVALLLLSACSKQEQSEAENGETVIRYENKHERPQEGGKLRLALTGARTLNPILTENQNNLSILKLIFDGLFCITPNKTVEPVLCEGYTVSADGLKYTFRIRDNVSFHNGKKLTAADVEASLALLLSSTGVYSERLSCVASHSSQGMFLTVELHYPVINLPALLDFPIMSADDMGTRSDLYVPNGTGRYKVQSYKQSKELHLTTNQNYYREFKPYIPEILVYQLKDSESAISMLENMQINLLSSSVLNLQEYTPKRQLASAEVPGNNFTFLGINNQQPALLSPQTRMAISYCINREELLTKCTISHATPSLLPVPPKSVLSGNPDFDIVYDPDESKTLLLEDGWHDVDGDGILEKDVYGESYKLALTLLVNQENPVRMKIAEEIKNYLHEIGVPVEIVPLSFEEYQARVQAWDYDLFVGGVSFADNFDVSFLIQTDVNPFGVSDSWLDQLLASLPLQPAETQKQALFFELSETIRNKAPFAGLYFDNELLIFDRKLKGEITPSATDLFYGIEKWFLAEEE